MGDNDPQGQQTGTEVPSDSLAAGFLASIPEADRGVVEQYVNQWDAGVTKKFNEIHDSYKGYKDLGEVDQLKTALDIYNYLQSDPAGSFKALAEELKNNGLKIEDLLGIQPTQQEAPKPPVLKPNEQQVQGIPEEFKKQFDEQQKLLLLLAQNFQAQQTEAQQRAEQEQLDNYLTKLKSDLGEFDEEWVLVKMYNGMDGEKAVKEYQNRFGKPGDFRPPPNLTGGAAIPTGTQSVADMSSKDTKSLVAQYLQAVKQQGN